jgi:hypothetical protein
MSKVKTSNLVNSSIIDLAFLFPGISNASDLS